MLGVPVVFRSIPDPARRGIRLSQLLTLKAFIETHADGDGILQGCLQDSELELIPALQKVTVMFSRRGVFSSADSSPRDSGTCSGTA